MLNLLGLTCLIVLTAGRLAAQGDPVPTREYIRLGERLVAMEAPAGAGNPWPPAAVFRDIWSALELISYGGGPVSAGGVYLSEPTAAQTPSGDTVAMLRDSYGGMWLNQYSAAGGAWLPAVYAGGPFAGKAAVAVDGAGGVWIAARDTWSSYWLRRYTPGSGFSGPWAYLGGVFASDPAIAGCRDGTAYLVGRDQYNALWSGWVVNSVFQSWVYGGGVVTGTAAVACGSDNAAYVGVRDTYGAAWAARVAGNTWTGWHFGNAAFTSDMTAAAGQGAVFFAGVNAGSVYYTTFIEGTGNGWQAWTASGALQSVSATSEGATLYLAGRDAWNGLWWFRSGANPPWTYAGGGGLALGDLSAAVR